MISARKLDLASVENQLAPSYVKNLRAYEGLKSSIDKTYPRGRFVGICDGQIVADAATHQDLLAKLEALGKDRKESLGVQAGAQYPYTTIF